MVRDHVEASECRLVLTAALNELTLLHGLYATYRDPSFVKGEYCLEARKDEYWQIDLSDITERIQRFLVLTRSANE